MSMKAVLGDITKLEVNAIVNAANNSLLGGGGVDGAIHRAAGIELLQFCRKLGGCNTGDAKITPGFKLKAKYVIHTVGPVWHGGNQGESTHLRNCYRKSLKLALEKGVRTIAFPSISTGVYHYPIEQASKIAVETVDRFLKENKSEMEVTFCCFSREDLEIYEEALSIL